MSVSDATAIAATRCWVSRFVVGHNVCPFAAREVRQGSIRYHAIAADDVEAALLAVVGACRELDDSPAIATTLLILPSGVVDFDDFLDLLGLAEALLDAEGYSGIYQLASFHPDYCFDGAAPNDPGNATNRSPWPMLHLLRETEMSRALDHYPDPEGIPERNIALMQCLGNARLSAELAACHAADAE